MRGKKISISFDDRVVVVNGEGYQCLTGSPANVHAMSWIPERDPCGYSEFKDGSGGGFTEFAVIEPYLRQWTAAKAAKIEADKKRADQAATEKKAHEAQVTALKAEQEKYRPINDALVLLGTTDHEVIKAIEADLVGKGALSADFVEQRKAARATVKAERARLGLKQ